MNFLEKDLETIIYETPDEILLRRGLWIIFGKKKRQLRIGNYGIADIVYFKRGYIDQDSIMVPALFVNVVELKKDNAGSEAFFQAISYAKGIQNYLRERSFKFKVVFQITIIAKNIDKNGSYVFLPDLINSENNFSVNNYEYTYDINGLKFKSVDHFQLKHENF